MHQTAPQEVDEPEKEIKEATIDCPHHEKQGDKPSQEGGTSILSCACATFLLLTLVPAENPPVLEQI